MSNNARKYSQLTIKRLYSNAGNRCAFPDCSTIFTNPDNDTNLSEICHIEDAKPGCRYNPNMSDEERSSYDNLILLCPNHHVETSNENKFNVEDLKKMKRTHEDSIRKQIDPLQILSRNPSALASLINYISDTPFDDINSENPALSFSIEEKINYNNVKRYRDVLDDYKIYHSKISQIYNEFEENGTFKKEIFLTSIKSYYIKAKSKILGSDFSTANIQANADNIIDEIEKLLWETLNHSPNIDAKIPIEAIRFYLYVIIVDSFMRCKILERPSIL